MGEGGVSGGRERDGLSPFGEPFVSLSFPEWEQNRSPQQLGFRQGFPPCPCSMSTTRLGLGFGFAPEDTRRQETQDTGFHFESLFLDQQRTDPAPLNRIERRKTAAFPWMNYRQSSTSWATGVRLCMNLLHRHRIQNGI